MSVLLDIIQHRNNLMDVRKKLQLGHLTVGFVGGSITADSRDAHNWPEPVIRWLVEAFPLARISVENAAIGATGSDLAVFRASRDLINRQCDLIFIEFVVNDYNTPTEKRMRAREGLIRKLLAGGDCNLVLVYTYCQQMYEAMSQDEVPASIHEFELLAEHYGISSVWAGKHAWNEVRLGRMVWDEWLPDGLHPTYRGSLSYAQSVISFLERELILTPILESVAPNKHLAAPLNPNHWENVALLPFADVVLEGPWTLKRSTVVMPWVDQLLCTSAIGAKLSFSFVGKGLAFVFDFGKKSAEFRYRLDGADEITTYRERPDWCNDGGWLQIYWINDELDEGSHDLELEIVHGNRPECTGSNFHLAMIGILK